MALSAGARLGPCEILAAVGAGGMGEVYRARDPRLGRDVAIKVLLSAFSLDPERLRRFEQEARAAAALSHPNILAVFDIGQERLRPARGAGGERGEAAPPSASERGWGPASSEDVVAYIVSELLEGETLRQKVTTGGRPVRRAVEYCVQVAHGLSAAHDKGIVHRDLKPENIFITSDGRVKILDFGLAKLTETAPALAAASALPTTPPDTVPGVVLGTIGYMSPEQVRGLTADHRSDIFAFGAILYEMLSGRRAFRGDTSIDTMTAILKEDPPDLPVADRQIPPALARIVDRCLAKSPSARFQTAADLAFALDALSTQSGATEAIATVARSERRNRFAWAIAAGFAVAFIGAAAAALIYVRRSPADAPVYRTAINVPPDARAAAAPPSGLALSPDGRRLAFSAISPDGRRLLWIRAIDTAAVQPLSDTDGASYPFWSPDSRFVAFTVRGQLKKIDVSGGPPVTLCEAPGGQDGSWGRRDVIVFAAGTAGKRVIWRVSAAGGTPSPATTLDTSVPDNRHVAPFFLPDGQHFMYLAVGSKTGGANDPRAVYVGSLDSKEPAKLLLPGGSNAKYAQDYLLFLRRQTLMAQPFDATRQELRGEALPVAQELTIGGVTGQIGAYSASDTGLLAYLVSAPITTSQLAWFDRAGKQLGVLGDQAGYGDIELSPDSTRAAVSVVDPAHDSTDIWLYDLTRGLRTRFTFDPVSEFAPIWSADSSSIVFSSNRNGYGSDLDQKPSSGAGSDDVLFADGSAKTPFSWSHDSRFILYGASLIGAGSSKSDLWVLPLSGDRKPSSFVQTKFDNSSGRFSPDSRWVAYVSDESGRDEVYVAPFPGAGGKWQVSRTGGSQPRWRRDGKEIFYLAPNNTLMAAAVNSPGSAFEVGTITPLFQTRARRDQRSAYDVSADGQRFFVNSLVGEPTSAPITLVVNWPALLKK